MLTFKGSFDSFLRSAAGSATELVGLWLSHTFTRNVIRSFVALAAVCGAKKAASSAGAPVSVLALTTSVTRTQGRV